jgi:hypothetical protein
MNSVQVFVPETLGLRFIGLVSHPTKSGATATIRTQVEYPIAKGDRIAALATKRCWVGTDVQRESVRRTSEPTWLLCRTRIIPAQDEAYQLSLPNRSPAALVPNARQTFGLIAARTNRALPSIVATFTPPE